MIFNIYSKDYHCLVLIKNTKNRVRHQVCYVIELSRCQVTNRCAVNPVTVPIVTNNCTVSHCMNLYIKFMHCHNEFLPMQKFSTRINK